MSKAIPTKDALELASENYKEYSVYVAAGRAYGSVIDGAKSVQKRVIYSLYKKAPRSIIKVAEAAGYCLDMHPHPTAVPEVIVSLGDTSNKFNFLDKQGNFGNRAKNIEASAPRYIGCRLSDLAIDLTCDGVEYCPTMTGELDKPEPIALPTLLPLCFLNSMSGIPAGLPKLNIPSLDIEGMFDYYLDILKHKDLNWVPKKLPIPNVGVPILSSKAEWEDVLKTGKGTVKLAPKMEIDKNGTITITAMPSSKTAEHVRKIIEKEILLDKVDMRDESTYETRIVIEKVFKKQCDMQELYDRLYKKLQASDTYNLAFFDQDHIRHQITGFFHRLFPGILMRMAFQFPITGCMAAGAMKLQKVSGKQLLYILKYPLAVGFGGAQSQHLAKTFPVYNGLYSRKRQKSL